MDREIIYVDRPKFDELRKKNSCQELTNDKVRGTTRVLGQEYVTHGFISDHIRGIYEIWGNQVVDVEKYEGDLQPQWYHDRHAQVKSSPGYQGQKAYCGKRIIVLTGQKVEFRCHEGGTQATIF